jgi:hypothetical protein
MPIVYFSFSLFCNVFSGLLFLLEQMGDRTEPTHGALLLPFIFVEVFSDRELMVFVLM